MTSDIITPEDTRWSDLLEKVHHDFYHTPEYLLFSSDFEGGEPIAFWVESDDGIFLMPLIKRPLPQQLCCPGDWSDAASPYGYPSYLYQAKSSAEIPASFLGQLLAAAREVGMVSIFVRLHPLFEVPHKMFGLYGELVNHGQTVYVDLGKSPEELRSETRENHRRGIKKLLKAGFRVEMNDWSHFAGFIELYRETMRRVDADSLYFFSDVYFDKLKSCLKDNLHLCAVLSPQGELCAAGLFVTCGDIIQYHLGGTHPEHLKSAPSKLMFDTIRAWGKGGGCRYFHLGGGFGASQDSLFHFKSGFSKSRCEFYTYRMIIDPAKYDACLEAWTNSHGLQDSADDNYFPGYRRS